MRRLLLRARTPHSPQFNRAFCLSLAVVSPGFAWFHRAVHIYGPDTTSPAVPPSIPTHARGHWHLSSSFTFFMTCTERKLAHQQRPSQRGFNITTPQNVSIRTAQCAARARQRLPTLPQRGAPPWCPRRAHRRPRRRPRNVGSPLRPRVRHTMLRSPPTTPIRTQKSLCTPAAACRGPAPLRASSPLAASLRTGRRPLLHDPTGCRASTEPARGRRAAARGITAKTHLAPAAGTVATP